MKIITENQLYGWVAYDENYDGPGSPIGSGKTEAEAIADFKEIIGEDDERTVET